MLVQTNSNVVTNWCPAISTFTIYVEVWSDEKNAKINNEIGKDRKYS